MTSISGDALDRRVLVEPAVPASAMRVPVRARDRGGSDLRRSSLRRVEAGFEAVFRDPDGRMRWLIDQVSIPGECRIRTPVSVPGDVASAEQAEWPVLATLQATPPKVLGSAQRDGRELELHAPKVYIGAGPGPVGASRALTVVALAAVPAAHLPPWTLYSEPVAEAPWAALGYRTCALRSV